LSWNERGEQETDSDNNRILHHFYLSRNDEVSDDSSVPQRKGKKHYSSRNNR
jgi:hypothetical protein